MKRTALRFLCCAGDTVCEGSTKRAQHFPRRSDGTEKFRVEERSAQHDEGRRTAAFSHVKGRR